MHKERYSDNAFAYTRDFDAEDKPAEAKTKAYKCDFDGYMSRMIKKGNWIVELNYPIKDKDGKFYKAQIFYRDTLPIDFYKDINLLDKENKTVNYYNVGNKGDLLLISNNGKNQQIKLIESKEHEKMDNSLMSFNFNQTNQDIRTITNDNGEIWFVAKDVCNILELNDVNKALLKLDDDEKLTRKLFVSGQNRELWLVNESGLYTLVIRSNKPEAKKFRKWITSEVIPSIRKKGFYSVNDNQSDNDLMDEITKKVMDAKKQYGFTKREQRVFAAGLYKKHNLTIPLIGIENDYNDYIRHNKTFMDLDYEEQEDIVYYLKSVILSSEKKFPDRNNTNIKNYKDIWGTVEYKDNKPYKAYIISSSLKEMVVNKYNIKTVREVIKPHCELDRKGNSRRKIYVIKNSYQIPGYVLFL